MAPLKYSLISRVIRFLRIRRDYELIILNYHSIIPDSDAPTAWEVCVSDFYQQMKYLSSLDIEIVNFGDVPRVLIDSDRRNRDCRYVSITFDDGFYDNYQLALPILKEFGFTATFAIIGCTLNKGKYNELSESFSKGGGYGKKFMSPSMISDLVLHNHEVANHTLTHPNFVQQTSLNLKKEIDESFNIINHLVNNTQRVFIVSYGVQERRDIKLQIIKHLKNLDVQVASLGRFGYISNIDKTDLYDLPRVPIYGYDTIEDFSIKIKGGYWVLEPVYAFIKRVRGALNGN